MGWKGFFFFVIFFSCLVRWLFSVGWSAFRCCCCGLLNFDYFQLLMKVLWVVVVVLCCISSYLTLAAITFTYFQHFYLLAAFIYIYTTFTHLQPHLHTRHHTCTLFSNIICTFYHIYKVVLHEDLHTFWVIFVTVHYLKKKGLRVYFLTFIFILNHTQLHMQYKFSAKKVLNDSPFFIYLWWLSSD